MSYLILQFRFSTFFCFLSEKYIEAVLKLEQQIEKAKSYPITDGKYASGLMGIESQGAIAYWAYIRVLIADDGINFISREHQGATDLMNLLYRSCLEYQ